MKTPGPKPASALTFKPAPVPASALTPKSTPVPLKAARHSLPSKPPSKSPLPSPPLKRARAQTSELPPRNAKKVKTQAPVSLLERMGSRPEPPVEGLRQLSIKSPGLKSPGGGGGGGFSIRGAALGKEEPPPTPPQTLLNRLGGEGRRHHKR